MKKSIFFLAFAVVLLLGFTTTNSAWPPVQPSPTPPSENNESIDIATLAWIDLGVIRIPTILSYVEVGFLDEFTITGDILESQVGVWGATWMYVGPLMGDYESLIEDAEGFMFDDGHVGIFMENFDWNIMGWIREDGNLVTLRHGGDLSIFTDNEELILQIVRSLR
ncbi:MAG: hypothetical protein FWD25_10130 [Clostridia bacterium]|nr:hypothetical protein [Clostridia bacterium]